VVIGTKSLFIGTKTEQAGEMQGDILAQIWKANPFYDKNKVGKVRCLMFKGDTDNIEAVVRTNFSTSRSKVLGPKLDLVNGQLELPRFSGSSVKPLFS
jgi:methyl-galactoside transport system substrate-binding protein